MFDNVKISTIITIVAVSVILLIFSVLTGINLSSLLSLAVVILGIGLLTVVELLLHKVKGRNLDIAIKIVGSYVILLLLLLVINIIIEQTSGSVFIYRKTIPGIIFFIYVSAILILSFFLINKYIKHKTWYISLQTLVILLVVILGMYDVLLIVMGGSSKTEVAFEDPDVTLYLVESSFLFGSSHSLYQKENIFYGKYLEHDGSFTCNDGCIIGRPEAFTWTWTDDTTLVISYNQFSSDITYYLPE